MASLNKVMLIGNLTRDPQLKYLPNQTAVCEAGLAVSRKFKGANGETKEDTAFVDLTIFGKGAEVFNQYMTKGKPVFVEGRLKFDSWEDKNGGGKRSKLAVVVEDFQFLGSKDTTGGSDETSQLPPPSRQPMPKRSAPQSGPPQAPYGDEQQFSDDDIPF